MRFLDDSYIPNIIVQINELTAYYSDIVIQIFIVKNMFAINPMIYTSRNYGNNIIGENPYFLVKNY